MAYQVSLKNGQLKRWKKLTNPIIPTLKKRFTDLRMIRVLKAIKS